MIPLFPLRHSLERLRPNDHRDQAEQEQPQALAERHTILLLPGTTGETQRSDPPRQDVKCCCLELLAMALELGCPRFLAHILPLVGLTAPQFLPGLRARRARARSLTNALKWT